MTAKRALIMHALDNVATAIDEVEVGDEVGARLGKEVQGLQAKEKVPFGFKIALEAIPEGGIIRKYGETIGVANQPIARGAMVHVHNLEGTRARGDLEGGKQV